MGKRHLAIVVQCPYCGVVHMDNQTCPACRSGQNDRDRVQDVEAILEKFSGKVSEKADEKLIALEARELERLTAIQELTGKAWLVDAEIGEYLYEQQRDFQRNLPEREANRRWKQFLSASGIRDLRTANNRIAKHLILRRIPRENHRKLASFLGFKTLRLLDALSDCKKGQVFSMLAKKFESIQSLDKDLIGNILDAWTRKVLNYGKETPTTGEAPTGEAPTGEAPTGEAPTGEAPTGEAPTAKEGRFIPLSIESLDSLPGPDERSDVLGQYIRSLEGLLAGLRELEMEELREYVGSDGNYIVAALTGLNKESVALSSRLKNLARKVA